MKMYVMIETVALKVLGKLVSRAASCRYTMSRSRTCYEQTPQALV